MAWGFYNGTNRQSGIDNAPLHAGPQVLFLPHLALAVAIKMAAHYIGMCRSLIILFSIRRRRFSKLDNMFTQADFFIAVILCSVAGLVEHAIG